MMIQQLGQIMLYVNDQDQAVKFWTEKLDFVVISENDNGQGMRWIEIAPGRGAQTTLVLQNKRLVAEMEPEINLGTPSMIFYTNDLEGLYQTYKDRGITVGELVDMPEGRVFNFADDENNYFAVLENK